MYEPYSNTYYSARSPRWFRSLLSRRVDNGDDYSWFSFNDDKLGMTSSSMQGSHGWWQWHGSGVGIKVLNVVDASLTARNEGRGRKSTLYGFMKLTGTKRKWSLCDATRGVLGYPTSKLDTSWFDFWQPDVEIHERLLQYINPNSTPDFFWHRPWWALLRLNIAERSNIIRYLPNQIYRNYFITVFLLIASACLI